jgi:hypothetical protein
VISTLIDATLMHNFKPAIQTHTAIRKAIVPVTVNDIHSAENAFVALATHSEDGSVVSDAKMLHHGSKVPAIGDFQAIASVIDGQRKASTKQTSDDIRDNATFDIPVRHMKHSQFAK